MIQPWIASLLLLAWLAYVLYQRLQSRAQTVLDEKKDDYVSELDPYQAIEPLSGFDWKSTPPIRNSPLKPKYHLTMALETITLSDIVAMDNTFEERMQVRRQTMEQHLDAAYKCNPICAPAVLELYRWLCGTYLPQRYPSIYKLNSTAGQLYNTVSNELIPTEEKDAITALKTLGSHVDTDFLLLLPCSTSPEGQPIYHLQAFICCMPSGFSLRKKLGLPLAAIHIPVPGYKQKLEKSMDRFFAKLPSGKAVKRANWAITTDTKLFTEGGNHLYHDAKTSEETDDDNAEHVEKLDMEAQIDAQRATVDVKHCRLRSERQTLFRLPKSGAIVFSFKTYQYRLEDVKNDGYGEELAQAIDGLASGNVPEMAFYKRQVIWGDKVKEYLRS